MKSELEKRIEQLNKLCDETTDPGDMLCVRASKEQGMLYEIYAGGYGFNAHCRTMVEAREIIENHYKALRQQGTES